jgi:hypothetical protein
MCVNLMTQVGLYRRDQMMVAARLSSPKSWPGMCYPEARLRRSGCDLWPTFCPPSETIPPRQSIIPYPSSVAILAMADKTRRIRSAPSQAFSCLATLVFIPPGQAESSELLRGGDAPAAVPAFAGFSRAARWCPEREAKCRASRVHRYRLPA